MHATYIRPRDLPQLQNSTASQERHSLQYFADTALKAATGFWFLVAVIGQWAFLYYIVAFYGPSTLQEDFQAWSKNTFLFKGYVAGDTAGNLDRKSTRLNSSHGYISYAVFCLKKKKK